VSSAPSFGDRSLFPELEAKVYLNHAAISPPSTAVKEALQGVVATYARHGVNAVRPFVEERDELRSRLGTLIGADSTEIGFVPNTSQGVVAAALSHPWNPGDQIVLFQGEFPTNVTPWQRAAQRYGLEIKWCPLTPFESSPEEGMQALEEIISPAVAMIAVSAVQFQTGLRMPLEALGALCRARGIALFVDAIQGCGAVPIDVGWGIDYLSCGGHKWLMGVEGAGFFYARQSRTQLWEPPFAGWLSHEEPLSFLFEGAGHLRYDRPLRRQADVVEVGAQNALGYAALGASLGLIESLGVPAIYAHINSYLDCLEPALIERGFHSKRTRLVSGRSGILSVIPPERLDGGMLTQSLAEEGVAVTFPDGHLRFAPHWPNSLDEVSGVIEALDRCVTRQVAKP
jgi:selenocysteine lyase/cysteine desulfurase